MILQTLDTVIAFALVMLLLSLMVTVLVQMVVSILGLRGRNLLFGLQQLVYAIAPDLSKEDIQSLAKMIQDHPFFQAGGRRSSIDIQPKEVLAALNQLRSNGSLATSIKTALDKLFTEGASSDSNLAETLNVLQSVRAGTAGEAESVSKLAGEVLSDTKEIVVRIDTWFDSAMNHAAEKFKLNTRWATAVLALLLAVSLQVDAPDILSQLWSDPSLRAEFIIQADQITGLYDALDEDQQDSDGRRALAEQLSDKLLETDLKIFYAFADTGDCYQQKLWKHLPGSLAAALLLSLGAPWWYGIIGQLVGYKSLLSTRKKEEGT